MMLTLNDSEWRADKFGIVAPDLGGMLGLGKGGKGSKGGMGGLGGKGELVRFYEWPSMLT
jgi:hypothetical protein